MSAIAAGACSECGAHLNRLARCPARCDLWQEIATLAESPASVRIAGCHYVIGTQDESAPAHCRGFGGAVYRIRFHDGREVTTCDLWKQGVIPPRFRDRLPDNAAFVWDHLRTTLEKSVENARAAA